MNIKKIALLLIIITLLFGLMICVKRIMPGPERTTGILVKALEAKDAEKVKKCFTGEALEYVEKKLGTGKESTLLLWAGKDYFKNIVWTVESTKKIDKNTVSCVIAATGGKEGAQWDFCDEILFTRQGWFSWKISGFPQEYTGSL